MKKFIIVISLLVSILSSLAAVSPLAAKVKAKQTQTNPLAEFTGKFQMVQKHGTVAIKIDLVNGELVCTQLWDGEKLLLRHLSGDNFIMAGFDWSIKFLRDKDKKISQILVMGTDRWDKVKE